MNNQEELEKLLKNVKYREQQINLLYDLLVRANSFLYPIFHLYGLSGTGKTFLIKKFMNHFCNGSTTVVGDLNASSKSSRKTLSDKLLCKKYYIYLNCKEMCHNMTLALFHEIVEQVQNILIRQNEEFVLEEETDLVISDVENVEKSSDCSNYIRQLKNLLGKLSNRTTKGFYFSSKLFNR
jgi:Cdc6-like AAA superfamily ATPase